MSFLRSHRGAMVVAAVVIVFSVLFGAHRSLVSLRGDALAVFELGANGDGHSVSADLAAQASACGNLYKVAAKYLAEDSAELRQLKEAYAQATSDVHDSAGAHRDLQPAFDAVYTALSAAPLTDQDRQYVEGFRSEMESRAFSIANDPYNAMALAFNNDVLGAFPTNLLRYAVFVEPLPVY